MKNKIYVLIAILLVITGGISFAYFSANVSFRGEGAEVTGEAGELIKVTYDAGTSTLATTSLIPGKTVSKTFKIAVTPGSDTNEVTYAIKLNINTNTFEKCDETNYSSFSNACIINAEELVYSLKDSEGNVINTGDLTGRTGEVILATETKVVDSKTEFNYTIEITFNETNADQNHNANKEITGNIKVEFSETKDNTGTICGTHKVTTSLGVLTVNDCEPAFIASNINEDVVEGLCIYNNQPVYNIMNILSGSDANPLATEENCGTTYEAIGYAYLDASSSAIMSQAMVGNGTWDSSTSTCSFNGQTVKYLSGIKLTEEEHCKEIYTTDGQTFFSGVREVGKAAWNPGYGGTGIYEAEDEEGISYYYRGAVNNNYVKFGGYYWRIIRINGNGSLRLIYNGKVDEVDAAGKETVLKNGYNDSSTGYTQIGSSEFNLYDEADNAYVGFMYGTPGSTTYEATHTNTNSSTIKTYLDEWYAENLASYASYLDTESGFCNDRSKNDTAGEWYNEDTALGYGDNLTLYGSYKRIEYEYKPSLKCVNNNDYFTIKNSNKGNKALTYPIGLITIDEVLYAGASKYENSSFYLYTGDDYLTMSPIGVQDLLVFVGLVDGDAYYKLVPTDMNYGVRPVINLNTNNYTISGNGTISNPYVVIEAE